MPRKKVPVEDQTLIAVLKQQGLSFTDIHKKFDGVYSYSTIQKYAKTEKTYKNLPKITEVIFKKAKYSEKMFKKFDKMLDIGLSADDDFAYSGVSLEFLLNIAELGYIPRSAFPNNNLYFVPKHFKKSVEIAKDFAFLNSQAGYVFNALKADFEDYGKICRLKILNTKKDDDDNEFNALVNKLAEKYDLSIGDFMSYLELSKRSASKGCILVLSHQLDSLFDFQKTENYKLPQKFFPVSKKGLKMDYITAIEPLAEKDWDTLANFQE